MIVFAAVSVAAAVALAVYLVAQMIPARPRAVRERLAELEALPLDGSAAEPRAERAPRNRRLLDLLEEMGAWIQASRDISIDRNLLSHAGARTQSALPIYWGARIALPFFLASFAFLLAHTLTGSMPATLLATLYFAVLGYIAPPFMLRARARKRQRELQKALPDTLDMMVVCVEAGLGLNQALMRVTREIGHFSSLMAQELGVVNAEIRAGVPREEALRNVADRTGLDDMRALVTVLIQTDRFGTSVARALRVHSDTMRTKRRQRAEEIAAKTTIKLVFPLAFCIFPSMFVVVLGPALIQMARALGDMA